MNARQIKRIQMFRDDTTQCPAVRQFAESLCPSDNTDLLVRLREDFEKIKRESITAKTTGGICAIADMAIAKINHELLSG